MKLVPNDARLELYRLQQSFAAMDISYPDYIWARRMAESPLANPPSNAWPFVRVEHQTATVTELKKRAKG